MTVGYIMEKLKKKYGEKARFIYYIDWIIWIAFIIAFAYLGHTFKNCTEECAKFVYCKEPEANFTIINNTPGDNLSELIQNIS
jgi:hypothetical protein